MNRRNFLKRLGLGGAAVGGMVIGLGVSGDDSPKTMTLQRTKPLVDGEVLMAEDLNTFEVSAVSQSVVSNTPDVVSTTTSSDTGTGIWRWDRINAMTQDELSVTERMNLATAALTLRRRQIEETTRIVARLNGRRV